MTNIPPPTNTIDALRRLQAAIDRLREEEKVKG